MARRVQFLSHGGVCAEPEDISGLPLFWGTACVCLCMLFKHHTRHT